MAMASSAVFVAALRGHAAGPCGPPVPDVLHAPPCPDRAFWPGPFGGWNVVGIAVEMLDRPLIDARVPEDLQATALEILQARDRVHRRHGLTGALHEGRLSVGELNKNYNVNVWEVAAPVFYRRYPEAKTAEGKFCSTESIET